MSKDIFNLEGQVAVVVGGTSGIGQAIALGLARAGADVVATSRRLPEVKQAAAAISSLGRRTLELASDVLDRSSLQSLHDKVVDAFGRVDILVNSAGITRRTPTL